MKQPPVITHRTPTSVGDGVLRALPLLLLSAVLQVPLALLLGGVLVLLEPPDLDRKRELRSLVLVEPPADKKKVEEPEDEPEEELDAGQIVEIAPPADQERPEEADYLAEYDSTVIEETKIDQFEVNPEVIAAVWSEEQKYEQEDLIDLNVDKESTGATIGNDSFEPDRNGALASLPSRWRYTNKDGLQDPVPTSHSQAAFSGAPQNDLIDEKRGELVAVNAKKFIYAAYINRIKRLVNYYWKQNVDNLPSSTRLAKPRYRTEVNAVLNRDGLLEMIEVTADSGSGELDDCVVRAFRVAGPFPNPPAGLVEKDGRVYLPDMDFTVVLGQAQNQYQGIDPRAGVQFPGILKAPR